MSSKPHTANFYLKRIYSDMASLSNDLKIPCVFTVFHKKKPESHGSNHLKKEAEKLLTKEPGWLQAMKKDLQELTAAAANDEETVKNLDDARKEKVPPPFPKPWALMDQNHLRSYLITCVMTSFWRSGGTKPRIQYFQTAGSEFKPLWWLEQDFPWSQLTNPCKKFNYPGPGNFVSFCKRSIRAAFEFHHWNITTWPNVEMENKQLVDAQRARGVRGLKYAEDVDADYVQMDEGDFLRLIVHVIQGFVFSF